MHANHRTGSPSYAGSYRLVYQGDNRYLQVRRGAAWVRIERPLPRHVRGCYAAAAYLGV